MTVDIPKGAAGDTAMALIDGQTVGSEERASGMLALVDLSYDYDPVGNIDEIDDGVREEMLTYQYDFLDRLTFAGVDDVSSLSGPQMIEERSYTYDQIGNLLSFRHRYPAAGQGRGDLAVGGSASSENNSTRGSFNGLSSTGLSSTNHSGSALMPYVGCV